MRQLAMCFHASGPWPLFTQAISCHHCTTTTTWSDNSAEAAGSLHRSSLRWVWGVPSIPHSQQRALRLASVPGRSGEKTWRSARVLPTAQAIGRTHRHSRLLLGTILHTVSFSIPSVCPTLDSPPEYPPRITQLDLPPRDRYLDSLSHPLLRTLPV